MNILISIFILCISLMSSSVGFTYASAPDYAQILENNVYLYKTASLNTDNSNIHFILEKTYFVELLSDSGEFYRARYCDITGYVLKTQVQCVSGTPATPYLQNVTMRACYSEGCIIYSQPNSASSYYIMNIPRYSRDLYYLGKIYGEALIPERTNLWYCVRYRTSTTDQIGYVYSDGVDQMTSYVKNTETLPYTELPSFMLTTDTVPKSTKNAIIILLSIPALLFVFMIIRGSSILYSTKPKSKTPSGEVKEFRS